MLPDFGVDPSSVDRRIARGPERAVESGEQSGRRENAEHQQRRAYADQGRAVGVRADRVNLPAALETAKNRADRDERRERDQDDGGDAEDAGSRP